MKFQFKITTWEEVTVDEKDEARVLQALKDGEVDSANDVLDLVDPNGHNCAILSGLDVQMLPEENDGHPTIEVMDGGETIWDNAEH